jgi:hypothetical protein
MVWQLLAEIQIWCALQMKQMSPCLEVGTLGSTLRPSENEAVPSEQWLSWLYPPSLLGSALVFLAEVSHLPNDQTGVVVQQKLSCSDAPASMSGDVTRGDQSLAS